MELYEGILIGIVVLFILGVIGVLYYEGQCTYENVTGVVLDKYDEEYNTVVVISNGKSAMVVPVYHHDFYIVTDYGELQVGKSNWNNYEVNDTINLILNVNTSSVKLNEVI